MKEYEQKKKILHLTMFTIIVIAFILLSSISVSAAYFYYDAGTGLITADAGISATSFSGAGTGLTGTASSLTAGAISGQGALATANAVSGGTGGTITDSTITAADLASGDFSSKITSGTYSISISGSAATANYATNATRLYASDSPYRYGDASPYYMSMTYDGTRWLLQASPATPAAVRVAYADAAGSAGSASSATNADTVDSLHATAFGRAYDSGYSFGGSNVAISTADFITMLTGLGAFSQPYWIARGSWCYACNNYISDTGIGNIHLAGSTVEVMGTAGTYTIRIHTPTTSASGVTDTEFIYVNNGEGYSPGWRKIWNDKNDGSGSGLDADTLDGTQPGSLSVSYAATAGSAPANGGNADTVDLLHKTSFGASIDTSGNNIRLLNSDGTQLSSITAPYATSAGDAGTIDSIDSSRIVYGDGVYKVTHTGSTLSPQLASGFYESDDASDGPEAAGWTHYIVNTHSNSGSGNGYQLILAQPYWSDTLYVRRVDSDTKRSWRKIWDNGTDGSGSGLDADTLDGISSDSFLLNTGDTATGNYTFGSTALHIDDTNDRVGIGTATPAAKLDVTTTLTQPSDFLNSYSSLTLNHTSANSSYLNLYGQFSSISVAVNTTENLGNTTLQGGYFSAKKRGSGDIRIVAGIGNGATVYGGDVTYGIRGISQQSTARALDANVTSPDLIEAFFSPIISSTSNLSVNVTNEYGAYLAPQSSASSGTSTATVGNMYGGYVKVAATQSSGGVNTVGNIYGLYVDNYASTATVTNKYALYLAEQTGATNNYALYSAGGTNYFGGNVGIGTAASWKLTVGASVSENAIAVISNTATDGYGVKIQAGSATRYALTVRNYADTELMSVRGDGNVGLGTGAPNYQLELSTNSAGKPTSDHWTITSDERLKENITLIPNALSTVLSLQGKEFNFINQTKYGNETQMGFIAQDVEKIIPQWVKTNGEGYKTLTIAGDTALLVEAIKEQQKQIAALKELVCLDHPGAEACIS
jgi:hypothetical protein